MLNKRWSKANRRAYSLALACGAEVPRKRVIQSNIRCLHHIRTMPPAITTRQQKGKALDEYKRTYKACIPCARRKVKCESEGGKCRRCITKKLDCTYTSKKPWSRDQGDRPSARPEREDSGPRYVFEIFGLLEADVPRTLGSTSDGNSRGGPGML